MSHSSTPSASIAVFRFLFENSLFLIGGAIVALVWANSDLESYRQVVHTPLAPGSTGAGFALQHVVNEGLMALFFALAAKEVWESLLPGGPLSKWKTAATPLIATMGGIVVPAALYALGCLIIGKWSTLGIGWAVPCATDIAFSYLVARFVFGAGHPAIKFLLLLAIADDAAGLVILAVAYPQASLHPEWLTGVVASILLGLMLRRIGIRSFWWYLLGPGILSWISFHYGGIHAALGLVPIIPLMPHAPDDPGLFESHVHHRDTLSEFARWWKNPVELILGLFGLVNAGVVFSHTGSATWLVVVGLVVGKPLGIVGFTLTGQWFFGLEQPDGMTMRHVVTLGLAAGIGFTVALFVSTAAFAQPGPIQDSAKMGALASFAAAPLAIIAGTCWGLRRTAESAQGPKE